MTRSLSQIRKQAWAAGVAVLAFSLAAFLQVMGWLEPWEAKTWDWRTRLMAEKGTATDDIVLVLVDQNSLDWGREVNGWPWPWPREVYAAIINYCKRNGAKALALDALFTEPSTYGKDDDEAFGHAIAAFGKVCCVVFPGENAGSRSNWPAEVPAPVFQIRGMEGRQPGRGNPAAVFPRAVFPIPEVSQNAAMLCNAHLEPDPDGIYRRLKPFGVFDGHCLPVMGLGCYLTGNSFASGEITPQGIRIGNRKAPTDADGNVILRYRPVAGSYRTYSAAAVIQSELRLLSGDPPTIPDGSVFKDKYVLVGFSAPGLYDLRPSPVSGVYPGVGVHATFIDNWLSGDFIRPSPLWLSLFLMFFFAVAGTLSVAYAVGLSALSLLSAVLLLMPSLLCLPAYGQGYWVPVMAPEIACAASIFMSLGVKYATEGRQKRFIKSAFRQYLSPTVIEQIIAHPERLRLGGERRVLSIFFSDLQGFTSISETLSPEDLTRLLNEYLTAMTDIITHLGGTVDKYEGDAIIAFWNAPVDTPGHAEKCVEAALQCQEQLARMRPDFHARTGHELYMRIGINTGPAMVGNFGSHTKFDYTMLGDAVNLAARLEGINKQFGTYTMISESTRREIGDTYAVREIGRVAVVGRRQAVTVFEPLRKHVFEARMLFHERFAEGLGCFYKGDFTAAKTIFTTLRKEDPVAKAYVTKCESLTTHRPTDWAGVWVMNEK